jgi:XTP/dITP diphosphohydrolase
MTQKTQITLVFASSNTGKIAEIKAMMPQGINLLGLHDIGCFEEIPETGDTLEANAILKADYVTRKYGYDCFADDSGLEVDALGGAPGVHSARYAGPSKDPEANMDKLLFELQDKPRSARFRTVLALNLGTGQHLFQGTVEGEIALQRSGTGGFGYDPLFIPSGQYRTFAEYSLHEKASVSHRGKAIHRLINFLSDISI